MTSTTASQKRTRKTSRRTFGSVRQLVSGRYQARYTDNQGLDRTAPQTFTTKTAADEWLTTERADLLRGTYRSPDLGATTFEEYFSGWLTGRLHISPRTRENYTLAGTRWFTRDLIAPATNGRTARAFNLGERNLNTLTVGAIREWHAAAHHTQRREAAERAVDAAYRALLRRHPARVWAETQGIALPSTGRLSPTIIKAWQRAGSPQPVRPIVDVDAALKPAPIVAQAYAVLRACLGDALRDGLIVANPCQLSSAGVVTSAERRIATPAEVTAMAQAMPPRFAVAVHLAAWTGLRAGELFGLAREHIDLEAGTVRVDRAMQEPRGAAPYLGPTKTPASRRTVHLPPHVTELLRDHLAQFVPTASTALVFARDDGSLLPRHRRTTMFGRARAAVGRDDLRWHDLRHTGATLGTQAGATLREIQQRLGHTTAAAAMRYQHASPERDREIAARLSEIASESDNVRTLRLAKTASS